MAGYWLLMSPSSRRRGPATRPRTRGPCVHRWVFLAVPAAMAACGAAEPDGSTWEARRHALGDTTVVHTVAGRSWAAAPSLREAAVIGRLDGPPEAVFGEVTRMAQDLDGGIYVFDGHGPVIRHYDSAGRYLGSVGGPGEGPGEYGNLTLGMAVDSAGVLHVHDWRGRRVVRFDEGGSPLDPWTLDTSLTTARGRWVHATGPGRLVVAARVDGRPALVRVDGGRVVDTLTVPRLPGMPELRGGPYTVDTYWAWHPDGYVVVGVSDAYTFDAYRPDGVLRIGRDVETLPVHPEEADAYRRQFTWMESQPYYRPPEGAWMPEVMPPFRGLEVGDDGRIWVLRNTDPVAVAGDEVREDGMPLVGWTQPFLYDVFEPDGTFLGEVRFPDRFEPHLFGDGYVWGVRRGEFDEHYVVRLAIDGTG